MLVSVFRVCSLNIVRSVSVMVYVAAMISFSCSSAMWFGTPRRIILCCARGFFKKLRSLLNDWLCPMSVVHLSLLLTFKSLRCSSSLL